MDHICIIYEITYRCHINFSYMHHICILITFIYASYMHLDNFHICHIKFHIWNGLISYMTKALHRCLTFFNIYDFLPMKKDIYGSYMLSYRLIYVLQCYMFDFSIYPESFNFIIKIFYWIFHPFI